MQLFFLIVKKIDRMAVLSALGTATFNDMKSLRGLLKRPFPHFSSYIRAIHKHHYS